MVLAKNHRQDDRVVAADFEHHEDGGQRGAQEIRQTELPSRPTHTSRLRRQVGKKIFSKVPMEAPSIAPIKSVGANMPPGVPLEKESVVARILSNASDQQKLPGELAMHGLVDDVIPGPHHLGSTEISRSRPRSDRRSAVGIPGPAGKPAQARPRRSPAPWRRSAAAMPPATPRTA